MSSEDVTDFAALISQYEATEHDMLNNLDAASAADSSAAKSNEVPLPLLTAQRNAPSMSDSDDDSENDDDDDESDTGNDDTSYTAEDENNEAEEDSETSYTEGNDDDDASESEDDSSEESEEWESDGDDDEEEEDQSSQQSYTEEGTSAHSEDDDDDDDGDDYGSQKNSPSYSGAAKSSKSSTRSMDPDGINATSDFEELAPMLRGRRNAPESDSDDSDSENQSHTSYEQDNQSGVPSSPDFISPVSIGEETDKFDSIANQRRNAPNLDSDSESDNASYEEDSQQGSANSEYEYVEEEIQEGGNDTNQKPDSTRSYESYETDDGDEGSASFYESGDEDDSGSDDESDSDSSYSKDSETDEYSDKKPSFNERGGSNHGFQHPTIANNAIGDDDSDSESSSDSDSNNSGWDDTGNMSQSESANDEEFENEPYRVPILGSDDNIEIESDSSDSESGFENEPKGKPQTKTKTKSKTKKSKGDSSDSDSSSSSDSDSDSDSSSDSSENDFDDEDHTIDVYDGVSPSSSKRKKKRGSNLSSTERSAELEHIINREKVVVDRENAVNTRERNFTRWFIVAAVIFLLGAIILVSVYFTRPGRKKAPTPSTVTITIPTNQPVAIPIGIPAPPTTPVPTPLPANIVIVETSFLAFVRDGKASGLTTENLESELQSSMGIFLPGLLTDVADSVASSRARRFLRKLQNDKLEIDNSINVDVSEIDCPTGSPETDLCVEVKTNVPIINSSNDFTDDFASGLQTAFSDALIQQFDSGILQTLGSTVALGVYEEGEKLPTEAPTAGPKDTTAPTKTPTEAPTEGPTAGDTQLRGSGVPTAVEPTDNIFVTSSPTPVANSNSTKSPTSAPDPTSQAPTAANVTSNVTSSPTVTPVCEDKNEACQETGEFGNCSLTKCAFWASEGECTNNPNYMNVNCEQSCGLCGDAEGPPEPACADENASCPDWAVQGECTRNEAYMSVNCKDSCGYCGCENQNIDCADSLSSNNTCIQSKCELWASQGECENNVDYMTIYCRKSCDQCVDLSCIDEDSRCVGWASSGECVNNPDYMSRNCKKSCAQC